jgi:hypothetical protein
MEIGVLSDSHNHEDFVKKALQAFKERGITTLIHCGDLTSAEIVKLFVGFEAYIVEGNMDSRRDAIKRAVGETEGPRFYGVKWETELAGKKIAVCHGDDSSLLNELLWTGEYDYLFHGHTHRVRDERVGKTRVVNPGSYDTKSVCIVDLADDEVEFVQLD